MTAVPKYIPYRNSKILDAAKGEACTFCGVEDGTVVAAHSNLQEDGKGMGKKADDCFVAFLCSEHHDQYDRKLKQRRDGGLELCFNQSDFERCMKITWKRLLSRGILK